VRGGPDRAFDLFQSDAGAPYEAPRRLRSRRTADGRVRLALPALTVSVLVLDAS
jgi:hypothetical protein